MPSGAAIRRQTVDMFVKHGFDHRDALLASSTFHTHLLGRLVVDSQPERTISSGEPTWSDEGLTAKAYAVHGLETIIAGLERMHLRRSALDRSKRRG